MIDWLNQIQGTRENSFSPLILQQPNFNRPFIIQSLKLIYSSQLSLRFSGCMQNGSNGSHFEDSNCTMDTNWIVLQKFLASSEFPIYGRGIVRLPRYIWNDSSVSLSFSMTSDLRSRRAFFYPSKNDVLFLKIQNLMFPRFVRSSFSRSIIALFIRPFIFLFIFAPTLSFFFQKQNPTNHFMRRSYYDVTLLYFFSFSKPCCRAMS